jgi:hypothetical protein
MAKYSIEYFGGNKLLAATRIPKFKLVFNPSPILNIMRGNGEELGTKMKEYGLTCSPIC